MKTRIALLFAFVLVGALAFAQVPKDGAIISLNSYDLTIKPGEEVQFPAQLVRSSRFTKGKIDGLQVQDKAGIDAVVTSTDQPDVYTISLTASPDLTASTFPIIIKATGRSAHKVKQTMIMVSVVVGQPVVSNNQ